MVLLPCVASSAFRTLAVQVLSSSMGANTAFIDFKWKKKPSFVRLSMLAATDQRNWAIELSPKKRLRGPGSEPYHCVGTATHVAESCQASGATQ